VPARAGAPMTRLRRRGTHSAMRRPTPRVPPSPVRLCRTGNSTGTPVPPPQERERMSPKQGRWSERQRCRSGGLNLYDRLIAAQLPDVLPGPRAAVHGPGDDGVTTSAVAPAATAGSESPVTSGLAPFGAGPVAGGDRWRRSAWRGDGTEQDHQRRTGDGVAGGYGVDFRKLLSLMFDRLMTGRRISSDTRFIHLDEGVEGGAGGVLERVADGVADDRALWASDPLPPWWPSSMYFLALSQAPPRWTGSWPSAGRPG